MCCRPGDHVHEQGQGEGRPGLPGQVEQVLRGAGPLTLKQISAKVGKDSFMGRGNVAQALAALHSVGKVKTNPAPEGTPQLKKVDFITYEAIERPS